MDSKYRKWIEINVTGSGYGQCAETTLKMLEAFPELVRVRGYYYDCVWGPREHWWLITSTGEVIDPTKAQFPDQDGTYEELPRNAEEPVGQCMNCGEYCFESLGGTTNTCSDKCSRETEACYNDLAGG